MQAAMTAIMQSAAFPTPRSAFASLSFNLWWYEWEERGGAGWEKCRCGRQQLSCLHSSMMGCTMRLAAEEGPSQRGTRAEEEGARQWGPQCSGEAAGQAQVPTPSLTLQGKAHRKDAACRQDSDSPIVGGNSDGSHFFLKIRTKQNVLKPPYTMKTALWFCWNAETLPFSFWSIVFPLLL